MRFHSQGRIAVSCLAVVLASCGSRSPTTHAPPAVDTEAPAVPAALSASVISNSQIALSWTASTDNVGVTGYLVERCIGTACANFSQIAQTASTMVSDTALAGATDYSYRVRAADAAGNMSDYSPVATASIRAVADTTPPTAPGGLAAAAISLSQVDLTWTASSDAVGVTGYLIERCQGASCTNFAQIATSATISFNNTGLAASTAYSYRVRASDAAGNFSAYSNVVGAVTPATNIVVSVTPVRGGLTVWQTLPLTATVANDVGGAGVIWSATAGSFNPKTATTATYVPPAGAGPITVTATSAVDGSQKATAILGVTDLAMVGTYHNDGARSGANTREFALTPANVNTASFGKLFSCPVDGAIYAQPLWIPNLTINGAQHNVVIVATQHDSVYAFDADTSPCLTLWHASLLDAAHGATAGETSVPSGTASGLVSPIRKRQAGGRHHRHAGHRPRIQNPVCRQQDRGSQRPAHLPATPRLESVGRH